MLSTYGLPASVPGFIHKLIVKPLTVEKAIGRITSVIYEKISPMKLADEGSSVSFTAMFEKPTKDSEPVNVTLFKG